MLGKRIVSCMDMPDYNDNGKCIEDSANRISAEDAEGEEHV